MCMEDTGQSGLPIPDWHAAPSAQPHGEIVQFLLSLVATLRRLVYIRRHLPGPKPHWLYGNFRDPGFMEPGFKWEQEAVTKYRRLLVVWIGWKPIVMLNHPDSIKPVLATNIGRKALDVLIDKLHVAADQGEPVKTHETMSQLSLDVILRCAFSHQSHCQETRSHAVDPNYHTSSIIHKDVKETSPEKKAMDFLDTLLLAKDSDGNGLSEKEIRDEVNTFIFAGTDTTGSALTWFLYIMAQHPEEQARVQDEVDTLFAGRDDDSVRYEDLKKLTYTTQCLRESVRLYLNIPPSRVLREPLKVNGFTIPAGTNVMVNLYQVHHNPDVWGDDHMDFKPERFERANVEKRDPFAFVPFSAGARNCIGQQFAMDELRSAAARIFRRFSVSLVKGARPVFQAVTKPDNEILLKFSHR
ncbi:ultra-long-chain fatty acid omega-hydroxylase-like [Diadema antillarum]|uniref:ultra-long-chain fatty acid omega-hydroxylase-like n=1 Tax=Diadema antillarum TaxID=105358 RepID=UPI003A889D46